MASARTLARQLDALRSREAGAAIRPAGRAATVTPAGAPIAPTVTTGLAGDVIRPTDPAYDEARQIFSPAVDRRPAAIVRAADVTDVVAAVRHARQTGLPLAVRSGGHSLAGHSTVDDGVVLDLRGLRRIDLEPETGTVWAQAGATAGELTAAAAEIGMAVPFGDAAGVGLGGITLGGGIGWLARKHGLTIDNLVEVEIVTADGELLTASETEHPDLFWALRGGGGNFGIATRFRYRLQPVGEILGGALILPATRSAIRGAIELAEAAPDELTTISMLMRLPPLPFIPAEAHGRPAYLMMAVYAGDPEAGQRAMAPFRELATPIADVMAPMPYPGIYALTADAENRHAAAIRTMFADGLDDEAIDRAIDAFGESESLDAMFQIRVLGGAMARVPEAATAFAHRRRRLMLTALAVHDGGESEAAATAWTEHVWAGLRPFAAGAYSNFLADEGESRIREAYPAATYARLAQIKRRYDPENLFRLNQNIRPAAG